MRMTDLISKKKEGGIHSRAELDFIISGVLSGEIPDYQTSAWLMAVCFAGCTEAETLELTLAMAHSGELLDFSGPNGSVIDKHSTGGVADTVTLIAAPLVAALGGRVVKMSGRGLGHTGGTIDKLEAMPGVATQPDAQALRRMVEQLGFCVFAQSPSIGPADKALYALRDVTATVNSIPLIASSIMSKKLATGADCIVFDVKVGSGSFLRTLPEAKKLARTLISLGKKLNKRVSALITDMNQPLGSFIGNGLELYEAYTFLSGGGEVGSPLYEVTMSVAAEMLMLSGLAEDEASAVERLRGAIRSGAGINCLKSLLKGLGAKEEFLARPELIFRGTKRAYVTAAKGGIIHSVNAAQMGRAALELGAGREKKDDIIDPAVGIRLMKRLGETAEAGEPLAMIFANSDEKLEAARALISGAIVISNTRPCGVRSVYEVMR